MKQTLAVILLMSLSISKTEAQSTNPACHGVNEAVSPLAKIYYQSLLRRESPHGATSTLILKMYQQKWLVLFADSSEGERGAFFFRRSNDGAYKHISTWGGVAGVDSTRSIADWTKTLGLNFPDALADCFAAAIVQGK